VTKTVVFSVFGGPDVLQIVDVPTPAPGRGEVRVEVKAAGVQPFDAHYRAGVFSHFVPATFPQTLGNEFAGVIDQVGPGVTDFSVGGEVIGFVWASAYAEHLVVGVDQIVAKPPATPWEEAGAISASGQTAHTAVEELAVGKDDTVLIHAAAGGVGTFAVQLARELGAIPIGTASDGNHDYLRALGAIPVAYGEGLIERVRVLAPGGVDAALDAHGGDEAIRTSVELVADRSRIGTLAAYAAADTLGIKLIGTKRSAERLAELVDLYEQGKLKVHVQETFPLDQVAAAHREVDAGHVRGKLLLTIG